MDEKTYGGHTVATLHEFLQRGDDTGETIDELTGDASSNANIIRDLLAALPSDAAQAPLTHEQRKAIMPTGAEVIELFQRAVKELPASLATEVWQLTPLQAAWVVGMLIQKHGAAPVAPAAAAPFDMLTHLARQREWSERTFGPGPRAKGVVDHIRKELREIEADPTDLTEWIDVVILALNGAWRAGGSPQQIIDTIVAKQTKNEGRIWPDWRTMPADKAIEHDRSLESAPASPTPLAAAGLTKQQIDAIMEQAQVFASAWSLVGGIFDSGNALETAEEEKANLRALLSTTHGDKQS